MRPKHQPRLLTHEDALDVFKELAIRRGLKHQMEHYTLEAIGQRFGVAPGVIFNMETGISYQDIAAEAGWYSDD